MSRILHAVALTCGLLVVGSAPGAPAVHHLVVRIATGSEGAPAGAFVELRLREAGRAERHLPLAGGAPWPAYSTRTVPVTLAEPLDPDAVTRISLYYRAPTGAAPSAWEVASAEVFASSADGHERSLGAPFQGLIRSTAEISSAERTASSLMCAADADCDDGLACNGRERCDPGARAADVRGCVAGVPVSCPTNQVCTERYGCRGSDSVEPARVSAAGGPPPASGREAAPAAAAGGAAAQSCNGRGVLLTEASGATHTAPCPAGTACVPQPNGSGVCAPVR